MPLSFIYPDFFFSKSYETQNLLHLWVIYGTILYFSILFVYLLYFMDTNKFM